MLLPNLSEAAAWEKSCRDSSEVISGQKGRKGSMSLLTIPVIINFMRARILSAWTAVNCS